MQFNGFIEEGRGEKPRRPLEIDRSNWFGEKTVFCTTLQNSFADIGGGRAVTDREANVTFEAGSAYFDGSFSGVEYGADIFMPSDAPWTFVTQARVDGNLADFPFIFTFKRTGGTDNWILFFSNHVNYGPICFATPNGGAGKARLGGDLWPSYAADELIGKTVTIAVSFNGGTFTDVNNYNFSVNGRGRQDTNTGGSLAGVSSDNSIGDNGASREWQGAIHLIQVATGFVGQEVLDSLARDPYQGLKPQNNVVYLPSAAGGGASVTAQNLAQAQTIGNVVLTQSHVIAPAGVAQAQTLSLVGVVQHHVLAVGELLQAQAIEAPAVTQHHIITPGGVAQGQAIDQLLLTQAHIIAVNDLAQAQTLDNVTLSAGGTISPAGLGQAQTLDQPALTVAHNLAVQGIAQGQSVDVLALTQHYVLAVAGLLQGQLLDNVTASLGAILADDLLQGQSVDAALLTEHAVLSVAGLTQSQLIDIVNLGGLVIGSLDGTLVAYALVEGEIVTRALLAADLDSDALLTGTLRTLH